MNKALITSIILPLYGYTNTFASLQDDLRVKFWEEEPTWLGGDPEEIIVGIFSLAEKYLLGIVWIVSVVMILYVAYVLLVSRGNEDDMKKALNTIKWLLIWLICVPLGYVVVSLITSFDF